MLGCKQTFVPLTGLTCSHTRESNILISTRSRKASPTPTKESYLHLVGLRGCLRPDCGRLPSWDITSAASQSDAFGDMERLKTHLKARMHCSIVLGSYRMLPLTTVCQVHVT